MPRSAVTQLMFEGRAEEAMTLYVSLFKGTVDRIEKYGPGEHGAEGTIKRAEFTLGGHRLACIDSPAKHAFTFTPSASLNSINPGLVHTEGARTLGVIGSEMEAGFVAQTPLGRAGQPADIASIAVFLASDAAGWLTGETLLATGGLR